MEHLVPVGTSQARVRADVGSASAELERTETDAARLKISYRLPGMAVSLNKISLQPGIASLCEAEIANVRASLRAVGDALASQLTDEGSDPALRLTTEDDDHRRWSDRGAKFLVQSSSYESEAKLRRCNGVSEAKLIRLTVQTTIAHREKSLRRIYAQILQEAEAKRSARDRERLMEPSSGAPPSPGRADPS